jgi:hypothetical protein
MITFPSLSTSAGKSIVSGSEIMNIQVILAGATFAAAALTFSAAQANTPQRSTIGASNATTSVILAKNGADNKAGDRGGRGRGGEGANHTWNSPAKSIVLARNGADDGAGHEAGEHARGDDHGGRR